MSSNLPLQWADKKNSPLLADFIVKYGAEYCMTAEEINQLRDATNEMAEIQKANFLGVAEPADVPTGTGRGYWEVIVPGTYTNHGNVYLGVDERGVIYRNEVGVFKLSKVGFSFVAYAKKAVTDIKIESKANLVVGKNKFNKATVTPNTYVEGSTGLLKSSTGYNSSDYIEVLPSTNYYLSNSGNGYRAYYTSDFVYISGTETGTTNGILYTSPSNAKYIRVTCLDAKLTTCQLELGSSTTAYVNYLKTVVEAEIPDSIARTSALDDFSLGINLLQKSIYSENAILQTHLSSQVGYCKVDGGFSVTAGFTTRVFDVANIERVKIQLASQAATGANAFAFYSVTSGFSASNFILGMTFADFLAKGSITEELIPNGAVRLLVCEFDNKIAGYTITGFVRDFDNNKIDGLDNRVTVLEDVNSKNIACFGDSITASSYPSNLVTILGPGYNVINNGVGSAWIQDISARFGGVPALLLNDLSIPSGTTPFVLSGINNKYQAGSFQIAPKYNLDRAQDAYSPLTIDNEDFNMVLTESGGVVTATLTRVTAGTAFTIKAGTKIYPASISKWRNGYTPIFFMGTNNVAGYNFDLPTYTPTIINYHKDCIKLVETPNFLVLGLFNISQRIYARDLIPSATPTNVDILAQYVAYEKQMTDEFGLNFIPLRKYLSSRKAIDDAIKLGYMTSGTANTNTSNDDLWISRGCAAYSFMQYSGGTDYTHPNGVGYQMIAWYVYNALKKLGV